MAAMDKAVILARGLGTRMRKADASAELSDEQATVADIGLKAMIPIGRPFLDYVLAGLADAGYRRLCLVIGPEHQQVRDYYARLRPARVRVEFAVQAEPLGTADAVAAAEDFAAGQPILVINSDNYYPVEALRALREGIDTSGLAAFRREGLLRGSNIDPERISKFAVVETDDSARLVRIIEKPTERDIRSVGEPVCLSMNCWRFAPAIFEACRSIRPSVRGELELPDAVQYAMETLHEPFSVLTFDAAVLDLSSRNDVAGVKARLADVEVRL